MRIATKSVFNIIAILSFVFFSNCESNQETELEISSKLELLENGEWLLKGFEDKVMYTFTNGERATYYGENDVFSNEPIPGKHAYSFQENKITIDLNFGNMVTYEIKFSCNNTIVEFYIDEKLNSTLYQRNSRYKDCL